jgi:hypothetical protein
MAKEPMPTAIPNLKASPKNLVPLPPPPHQQASSSMLPTQNTIKPLTYPSHN